MNRNAETADQNTQKQRKHIHLLRGESISTDQTNTKRILIVSADMSANLMLRPTGLNEPVRLHTVRQ